MDWAQTAQSCVSYPLAAESACRLDRQNIGFVENILMDQLYIVVIVGL